MGDGTDSDVRMKPVTYVVTLFKNSRGEWYNRTNRIKGGQVVQIGGEGYKRRGSMLRTLQRIYPQIVGRELVRVGGSWQIRF